MIGETFRGFMAPYRAVPVILKRPRLIVLSILPFLLTVAIYVLLFWLAWRYIPPLLPSDGGDPSWWWRALEVLVRIVIVVLFLVLGVFTYATIAFAVGGPLNEFLSVAAEKVIAGEAFEYDFTVGGFLMDMVRGVLHAAELIGLQLLVLVGGLIFPPVSTVIAFFLAQFLLAMEYVDYPMARHRMHFRGKLRLAWRHKWLMFGFGSSLFLGFLIPVLGAIYMPLGVVGGIMIWLAMKPEEEQAATAA